MDSDVIYQIQNKFWYNSYTVKNTFAYLNHTAYIPWDKTCSPIEGKVWTIISIFIKNKTFGVAHS
jgi:hypothetical protein